MRHASSSGLDFIAGKVQIQLLRWAVSVVLVFSFVCFGGSEDI